MELLDRSRPQKGKHARVSLGHFAEQAMGVVGRAYPGDRVLVSLPESPQPFERDDILTMRLSLVKALKFFEKDYSVRYNDISQKFVLVPPDKLDVYCYSVRGKRRQPVLEAAK